MRKLAHLIKDYPFSTLLIIVIWVLCLIPIPETPLSDVSMIDKWTHLVMYGTLCLVVLLEQWIRHKAPSVKEALLFGFVLPSLMGGLIELAQAYCTGGCRSGDWLDFATDALGALLGLIIYFLLVACFSRCKKGISKGGNCKSDDRQ